MKNKRKIISIIIFLIVLLMIIVPIILNFYYQNQKDVVKEKYNSIETESVKETIEIARSEFKNEDILGELEVENTNIKEPIVKGIDNEYYLNHLVDKSYNTLGNPFLDYRNSLYDKKIIIYGHNFQYLSAAFHDLEKLLDINNYNSHSMIYLKTSSEILTYKIFSVYIAKEDMRHVNLNFNIDTYNDHVSWLKKQSLYNTNIEVGKNDNILVLQTCNYTVKDSFIVVVGKKI